MAGGASSGWGTFRLGSTVFALPFGVLREVIPCGALRPVPGAPGCIAGACELRGTLVPVVELATLLDQPPPGAHAVVVLVVHDGRMVGLRADDAADVFDAPATALRRASAGDGAPLLLAGSLERPDTGGVVMVLDLQALAALPGMVLVDDPEPARAAPPVDGAGQEHQPEGLSLMLVRCGHVQFAVEAAGIAAAVPDPVLQHSALAGGACRGAIDHAGLRVGALDLLDWCGLGTQPAASLERAIVLRAGTGLVALLVAQVMDVVRVAPADVLPLAGLGLPRRGLVRGALPGREPGAPPLLVLDLAALQADALVQALAGTNVAADGSDAALPGSPLTLEGGRSAADDRVALLTYEAGCEVATPIEQVGEILPYRPPAALLVPGGTLLDIVIERGRSIPVFDLAAVLGLEPPALDASARVLVVQGPRSLVGFAVPALHAIDRGREHELAAGATGLRYAFTGDGEAERTLRVVDLEAVAATLDQAAVEA